MSTVKDLDVTEQKIRDYVLRNNKEALTQEQLDGICYDYLNKVMRNVQDKWPKDLRADLARVGIVRDHETGLPMIAESAQTLKTYSEYTITNMSDMLAQLRLITEQNDIITLVDGLPLKDLTDTEDNELEVNNLLGALELSNAFKTSCDNYIDKLLKIMADNDVEAPPFMPEEQ